jgi:tryptophan synthase alpha chain
MNKLTKLFDSGRRDLLSLYVTAGFPHRDATIPLLRALLADDGVDMIELGFPFSDPLADGPVIQRAGEQALAGGMSCAVLFEQLDSLREELSASPKPVLLMGYFNPLLQYGVERFCAAAAAAGISGLIVPDLPVELYAAAYRPAFERHGLAFVPLVTPDTPEPRLRYIDALAGGFLYLVAVAGTTGTDAVFDAERGARLEHLTTLGLRHPLMIGFGIHDRVSFQAACRYAAGAIIGTALIRALGQGGDPAAIVRAFVRSIRAEEASRQTLCR